MFSPNKLFEDALGIKSPQSIKEAKFDKKKQRLDIYTDFKREQSSIMKMKSHVLKELLKHMIILIKLGVI